VGQGAGWAREIVLAAVDRQRHRVTPGIEDMAKYLTKQVQDESHREVSGPLLPASGASGVIVHGDEVVAGWGDPAAPEMAFSATKSVVSMVAGVAVRSGLLRDVEEPVSARVTLPEFAAGSASTITWEHLLQQTSQWDGELWGKPAAADAQSKTPKSAADAEPGSIWSYNDVRVNLLCLALTALFRAPLPTVLDEHIMRPLGASTTWSWHGYSNSTLTVETGRIPVVSGGAHWGGGLFVSANDLALLGRLCLNHGRWAGQVLIDSEWIARSWHPSTHNPDYGYLWWLNSRQAVLPTAPATGVLARGNQGQHVLWIDPARDLVIATHWSPDMGHFIGDVSRAFPER
jgi:CubicO group peptidase (beta-lactamase class C family)